MKHLPRLILKLMLGTTLALLGANAATASEPEAGPTGLTRLDTRHLDDVFIAASTDLDAYSSFFIAQPNVEFRRNWKRDQNRNLPRKIRDEDMQRIRDQLAQILTDVFAEELAAGEKTLASQPGDGVLVITPNIIQLDVVAPDIQNAQRYQQFSEYAGEMTLDMQIEDGSTGELLMQVKDRKRDMHNGFLEWRTGPGNRADASRMIRVWARDVRDLLDAPASVAAR